MANPTVTVKNVKPLLPSTVLPGKAGAAITAAVGKVVRRDSDGDWVLAQADSLANATGEIGIVVATGRIEQDGDALEGEALSVLIQGRIAGLTVLDETKNYYLSDNTAGLIEDVAPTFLRFVGNAENSETFYFNPVGAPASV